MPTPNGAVPRRVPDDRWLARRHSVADGVVAPLRTGAIDPAQAEQAVSASMWRLEQARREPPLATSDIAAVLEAAIDPLRRLDDSEGGNAAAVGYIQSHLDTIAAYLIRGRTTSPAVRQRLIRAGAQFYQLAGWMAFDAERHTSAQRYFRAGLRAARDISDDDLIAHILGCMAYHVACQGQRGEATQLAAAAVTVGKRAHPAVLSLTYSRLGHAHAAAGDVRGTRSSFDLARDHKPCSDGADAPDFLYWFDQKHMDILHGQALQLLAFSSGAKPSTLLGEADKFLLGKIDENTESIPRDSLFHSAWLARSQLLRGELEQAASTARRVMHGLKGVYSSRTVMTLRRLDTDLAARRSVADLKDAQELRRELHPLITA